MVTSFDIAAERAESINPDATEVYVNLPSGSYETSTPTSGQIAMFQQRINKGDGTSAIFKLLNSVLEIEALPIDRFCNVVYHLAMERVKDKPQFIYQLTKRVSGQKPSKKQVNEDADAFMAFAGAFGVAPPSASPDLDS